MKYLFPLALAFAIALVLPSAGTAQPGPIGISCDCDFCYANPYAECRAGRDLGSGPCGLYFYLFCCPWHQGCPTFGATSEAPQDWRELTLADQLMMLRSAGAEQHPETEATRLAPHVDAETLESVATATVG